VIDIVLVIVSSVLLAKSVIEHIVFLCHKEDSEEVNVMMQNGAPRETMDDVY